MKIRIEINESELKTLVVERLERLLGGTDLDLNKLKIEVKSKQNYKSEWEPAAYRAVYEAF